MSHVETEGACLTAPSLSLSLCPAGVVKGKVGDMIGGGTKEPKKDQGDLSILSYNANTVM